MNTIQERIIKYLDHEGVSKYKFYKLTGLSNGFLDKRGSIGSENCEIISSQFPNLSLEWIITGKGTMVKSSEKMVDDAGLKDKVIELQDIIIEQHQTIRELEHKLNNLEQSGVSNTSAKSA